jgi:hypothetical protein
LFLASFGGREDKGEAGRVKLALTLTLSPASGRGKTFKKAALLSDFIKVTDMF